MSPVTPTPGLTPTPAATTKGAAAPSTEPSGPQATDATKPFVPNLCSGKAVPGPDEWRALERRASSFRL